MQYGKKGKKATVKRQQLLTAKDVIHLLKNYKKLFNLKSSASINLFTFKNDKNVSRFLSGEKYFFNPL